MTPSRRPSTALAALFVLAASQGAAAQERIGADRIAAHREAMAAEQPALAAALAREIEAGLAMGDLTCADSALPPPCIEGAALMTPQGIAVVLGEDDSILLAPRAAQVGNVPETPQSVPDEPAAAPEAAPDTTPAAATQEDAPAADEAQQPAPDESIAASEAAPGDAPADAAQEDAPAAAEAPEPAPDVTRATPEATQDDAPAAGEAPEALPETAGAPPERRRPGRDRAAASDETAGAVPDTASDTAEAPPRRRLGRDRPAAAPDTSQVAPDAEAETARVPRRPGRDRPTAPDAAAMPETADAEAPRRRFGRDRPAEVTPEAAPPDAAQLAERLARRPGITPEDAAAEDTAPEARVETPDAAATRAAEAIAPAAAALATADEADAGGPALTVTEGTARSSAEDFATSVAEALRAQAPAQPAAGSGSNTERDLARALLAGLAGYAVGQAVGDQGQVALNSGDRVVITRGDGSQQVLKDDSALMFQPGAQVQTQNFEDGSSRIVVTREDGSRVVTIRDAELRVLRRTLINPDGSEVKLIDDTAPVAPVRVSDLPPAARPLAPVLSDEAALRRALEASANQSRRFTLGQIRDIAGVRALVAPVNIDAITFDTGSAAIRPDQARQLAALGKVIADAVRADPAEIFLVEGYTDTVGSDAMNLALSDRRAESLALALTEYFAVPPENLVVQGYGERFLKVPAEGDIRENRRVAVRRITDLLARN